MAHELEIAATVEGVETEDELRSVVACGIDSIQGYLFARPMPAADVAHWLVHTGPERLRAMRAILAAPPLAPATLE
ncbi:putative cyclic-di-GMP phosphodiesterase AdrB [compost metagenome]